MLNVDNENEFIDALRNLYSNGQKMILARRGGNNLFPVAEIRDMATTGGAQFGLAEIDDFTGQRYSGVYTPDVEEAYIRALDFKKKRPNHDFYLVEDSEHTPRSMY